MMDYMFDKNYNDYYNLFSKYNINMMKRELIKFKTEKEMIENQREFVDSNYISAVSLAISIFTLIMASLDKFNLFIEKIKAIFIFLIIVIILLLAIFILCELAHKSRNDERNNEIYDLNLKIQIIENLIAEREKKK